MRDQIRSTALASILAAGLIVAQVAAGGQTEQHALETEPVYQEQLVTVEGCLRREGAPEEATPELTAVPDGDVIFVLSDAEVRSRIDTMPGTEGTAVDERPLGPAGLESERLGLPADGLPVEDETEPRPGQTDEQPGSPAVAGVPTPAEDRYVVVGLDEGQLKPFAGQRVAMTGQFEPPVASVMPGAVGAGPEQDGPTGDAVPSATGTSGSERWPPALPRFRAASVKPVPGICPPKP